MIFTAAIAHAAYFVLQRHILAIYKPIEVTSYAIWGGTISMVPFGFGFVDRMTSASIQSTVSVVYLGIFPAAVAYFSWSYVLSKVPASKAASYLFSVPR